MPRDGALILSDVRSPTLGIVPCGRRGRYNVQRLIAMYGADIRLPDLRAILANCGKARSFSVYDLCKAKFERPKGWRALTRQQP
jgi:hypothetical protein